MHTYSALPGGRILFVCDTPSANATAACSRLCDALVSVGAAPRVLRGWPAASPASRRAAKIQDHPYPVFCSQDVRAEAPLLALLEQPAMAITLGKDPVGLALPLLDSGVPCVAWMLDEQGLPSFPDGPVDRRLGLTAASSALAARLAVLTGSPVATLLPPQPSARHFAGGGDAILVPAHRRVDGLQRVLEMARARPDYRFQILSDAADGAAASAHRSQLPANVSWVDPSAGISSYRVAVLPALGSSLPWSTLAQCLAAGIPVLGSTEPLLLETLQAPDLVVSATAALEEWLAPLDWMMRDDLAHADMRRLAVERSASLGLPPQQAAQQCLHIAGQHAASVSHLVTGRL